MPTPGSPALGTPPSTFVYGLGFRVEGEEFCGYRGLSFGVRRGGVGFRVSGLGFGGWSLGFGVGVWGLGSGFGV